MPLPLVAVGAGSIIATFTGYTVTKILLALGVTYVVFQGMDVLFAAAEAEILGYFGQLPGDIFSILMLCGVGEAATILLSAFSTKILLIGFQNGAKAFMSLRTS